MKDQEINNGIELTRKQFLQTSGIAVSGLLGANGVARVRADNGEVPTAEKLLFFDDYWVANSDGISRTVHEADKHGDPLMHPTEPWERGLGKGELNGNVYVYGTVIHDDEDDVFEIWYHTYSVEAGTYFTLYATSEDGYDWEKPDLGVYKYEGSTDNNIVGDMHSPSVVKDPDPDDPARQYKMMSYVYGQGYSVWFSSDGVEWTEYSGNPVLPGADVANVVYDKYADRFVALFKQQPKIKGALDEPIPRRSIYVAYSDDFVDWTDIEFALGSDAKGDRQAQEMGWHHAEIYGMGAMSYETHYVGFPWYFATDESRGDGIIPVQTAFSTDGGRTWDRGHREPTIALGPEGDFDSGMNFTTNEPIVIDDEIRMYYGGWNGTHGTGNRGAAIGLATWRRDGFASYTHRGDGEGRIETDPFTFEGNDLLVNADLENDGRENGSLELEVLDEDGGVIDGFERVNCVAVRGDELDRTVNWEGPADVGALAGETVRLRIFLSDGHLYSARFATAE